MLLKLFFLLTIVPLTELALLFWIGSKTGWPFTVSLVLATGILGSWLARQQGLRCWRKIQQEIEAGRLPGDPLIDGLMILIAGVVLVTPGVLTDLFGFALLVPFFRRMVKRGLMSRLRFRVQTFSPPDGWPTSDARPDGHDRIIDTRVIDVPSDEPEGE